AEGPARAPWLAYVVDGCIAAMRRGCELRGGTLYPALDHPGAADGRHCENGLRDHAADDGRRAEHAPLLAALRRTTGARRAARDAMLARRAVRATRAAEHLGA